MRNNNDMFFVVYREFEFHKQKFHGILYLTDDYEDARMIAKKLKNIYEIMKQKVIIDIRTVKLKDTGTVDMLEEIARIGEITLEEENKKKKKTPLFDTQKKEKIASSEDILSLIRNVLEGKSK